MKIIFGFCLRFFCSFVVAKLLLRVFQADSMGYLLGLSLFFTLNLYWFDSAKNSDQFSLPKSNNREQKNKAAERPVPLPSSGPEQ